MPGNIDFIVPVVLKNYQASFVVSSTVVTPDPALLTYSGSSDKIGDVSSIGTYLW